jgi:hypothetical protein
MKKKLLVEKEKINVLKDCFETDLNQQWPFLPAELSFTRLVNLVQRVFRDLKHLHVRPELLDERLDDFLRRCHRRHSDALRRNFLWTSVIKPS